MLLLLVGCCSFVDLGIVAVVIVAVAVVAVAVGSAEVVIFGVVGGDVVAYYPFSIFFSTFLPFT